VPPITVLEYAAGRIRSKKRNDPATQNQRDYRGGSAFTWLASFVLDVNLSTPAHLTVRRVSHQ
jgi:hypothetical protein